VRGRPSPLSDDLRRDVGIWAALLIAIHTFFGLQVHFGGTVLPYFLKVAGTYDPASFPRLAQPIAAALPFRIDPFGIGNEPSATAAGSDSSSSTTSCSRSPWSTAFCIRTSSSWGGRAPGLPSSGYSGD
jgi:hypothetical protein